MAALRGGCNVAATAPTISPPPPLPTTTATAALAALPRDDAQMALVRHVAALLAGTATTSSSAAAQPPPHYVYLMLCRVVSGAPELETWMRDAEARAAAAEPDRGLAHVTMVCGALAHALPLFGGGAGATDDDFEQFLATVRTQLTAALAGGAN